LALPYGAIAVNIALIMVPTATVSQPLNTSKCVSWHHSKELVEDFVEAKFYHLHTIADGS